MYGMCRWVSKWKDGWLGKIQCEKCECEGVSGLRLSSSVEVGSRYGDAACVLRDSETELERWDERRDAR